MVHDLHKQRASIIFGVDYDKVTPEQRRYAKSQSFFNDYYTENNTVNFLKPFKATHVVVKLDIDANCTFAVGTALQHCGADLYRDADNVHAFVHDCFVEEIAQKTQIVLDSLHKNS